MIRRQVLVGLFVVQFLLLTLRLLAQGELNAPERPVFDEANGKWHRTAKTGEDDYGCYTEYQSRAKNSTTWPTDWNSLSSVEDGDGRVNVERRVIIPAASFDRNLHDYRIRVKYQVDQGGQLADDSSWSTSN